MMDSPVTYLINFSICDLAMFVNHRTHWPRAMNKSRLGTAKISWRSRFVLGCICTGNRVMYRRVFTAIIDECTKIWAPCTGLCNDRAPQRMFAPTELAHDYRINPRCYGELCLGTSRLTASSVDDCMIRQHDKLMTAPSSDDCMMHNELSDASSAAREAKLGSECKDNMRRGSVYGVAYFRINVSAVKHGLTGQIRNVTKAAQSLLF